MTTPILGFPEIEVGMWHRGKEAAFNELVSMLDAGLSGIFGDADLVAIAALAGTGIAVRTAADTWALRTTVAPASGLTITNPAGIAGNITFALANDLAALEGLAGTGIACRTAADTWAQRTLTAPAAGLTITNPAGVAGNPTFAFANDLAALEGLAGTGIAVRTAADTWAQRTITGTTGEIDVTNGNGVSGNPVLSLPTTIELSGHILSDSGDGIIPVRGSGTGIANVSGFQFQQSDGTPAGFVGDASAGIDGMYLVSYTGDIRFLCNGTANTDYVMTETYFGPTISGARDLGLSSVRFDQAYVQGVNFPATQVASADANTLDDYEEGTWTPTLTFATPGNLTVVYSSRIGTYTKVGRTVDYKCNIVTTTFTHTTASGLAIVTGIPFTMSAFSPVAVGLSSGFTIGADFQFGAMLTSAQISLYGWNNSTGAGATNLTTAHLPSGVNKSLYLGGPGHV